MENNEKLKEDYIQPRSPKLIGVFIILIGIIYLLKMIPETSWMIPKWLFTWPVFLIIIGIFQLIKNRRNNPTGGLILTFIGLFFLIKNQVILMNNIDRYVLPILIIGIGIIFLFTSRGGANFSFFKKDLKRLTKPGVDYDSNDALNANSIFGSIGRNVLSKKFIGGNVNCIFGGVEIDLTQADIEGTAVLDFSVLFGGVELFVPSNWVIKNEVNVILGGVEEKRRRFTPSDEPVKTLILRGFVIFGGLDIKN